MSDVKVRRELFVVIVKVQASNTEFQFIIHTKHDSLMTITIVTLIV